MGITTRPVRTLLVRAVIAAGLLALSAASMVPANAADAAEVLGEDAALARVFAADAKRQESIEPDEALLRGEDVEPEVFSLLYTDTLDRRALASARRALAELRTIRRDRLSDKARLSYDIYAGDKHEKIAWLRPDIKALTAIRPFNHFGGIHIEFPSLMAIDGAARYETQQDYERALQLNAAFAGVLDNAVLRFREGLRSGVVESKLTVRIMIAQIDALLAQPDAQSPFLSPVREFPEAVPLASRERLRRDFADVVQQRLYPAYRRLRQFLADDYLPAAREQAGLSAMKGGAGLYRRLIERETTLRLEPDAVHQIGLSEVARIQRDMQSVQRKLGHSGALRDFFDIVRTDPRYHPAAAADLEHGFARIARRVDAQIPRYFARVPKTPLVIRPYPEYRAKYEAGGSYSEGAPDGSRPGMFYYNTYDLPSRFLTGMATLYLHEGSPGHHFQISLAQEDESLPDFQKFGGNNAFIEGWALYAETLGYDMGLYDDPEQHWGTLDDEMLRAMRLVVDTGIHAKGWSRERAIDYMLANSGMGRSDATAEVERYIANPAQALSYKIGAMTIQRLRKQAETALGPRFDIRAFHEQVLGSGVLPLPQLEQKIAAWIAVNR